MDSFEYFKIGYDIREERLKMKTILMITGTSSISEYFIKQNIVNFNFIATFRSKKKIYNNSEIKWLKLNLYSTISKKLFFSKIKKMHYSSVVISVGVLSNSIKKSYSNRKIRKKIMQINFFEVINLIDKLIKFENSPEKIIVFSSISAHRGSFDEIYASSKAAMNAWVISKNKKVKNSTKIYIISPSLIANTRMYNSMTTETIEKHKQLRESGLVDLGEISSLLCAILSTDASEIAEITLMD